MDKVKNKITQLFKMFIAILLTLLSPFDDTGSQKTIYSNMRIYKKLDRKLKISKRRIVKLIFELKNKKKKEKSEEAKQKELKKQLQELEKRDKKEITKQEQKTIKEIKKESKRRKIIEKNMIGVVALVTLPVLQVIEKVNEKKEIEALIKEKQIYINGTKIKLEAKKDIQKIEQSFKEVKENISAIVTWEKDEKKRIKESDNKIKKAIEALIIEETLKTKQEEKAQKETNEKQEQQNQQERKLTPYEEAKKLEELLEEDRKEKEKLIKYNDPIGTIRNILQNNFNTPPVLPLLRIRIINDLFNLSKLNNSLVSILKSQNVYVGYRRLSSVALLSKKLGIVEREYLLFENLEYITTIKQILIKKYGKTYETNAILSRLDDIELDLTVQIKELERGKVKKLGVNPITRRNQNKEVNNRV